MQVTLTCCISSHILLMLKLMTVVLFALFRPMADEHSLVALHFYGNAAVMHV